jgi:Putative DNA-binding domain
VDDDESDYGGLYRLGIQITFPIRGKTVAHAYRLGRGVLALYEAAENGGALTRETALGVLEGGRADVLVGLSETDWIDFKREPYKKDDHGKLELAKDVAAFANADGGLLLLGVAVTQVRADGDCIHTKARSPADPRLHHGDRRPAPLLRCDVTNRLGQLPAVPLPGLPGRRSARRTPRGELLS